MIRPEELNALMGMSEDAGRLLAFALTPKARPSLPTYAELLKRYQSDVSLQILTEGLARGLGLRVLEVGPLGMVLGAQDDSPFALRLADYRQNLSSEDRMVHGLIQLAIAAWCFPTAQALEDSSRSVITLSAPQVVQYLRDLALKLKAQAEQDPEIASPELREAWRVVLALPEIRETPDSRRSAGTLKGMVQYALEQLEKNGMLKRSQDETGETYRTLSAYRVQVRELGALSSFRWIQETRRRCPDFILSGS